MENFSLNKNKQSKHDGEKYRPVEMSNDLNTVDYLFQTVSDKVRLTTLTSCDKLPSKNMDQQSITGNANNITLKIHKSNEIAFSI